MHERLLTRLKGSAKLFADETTAPVLDPGRGKTKTGQLWAWATIATLLATARMNQVDPLAWLTHTLERIANG